MSGREPTWPRTLVRGDCIGIFAPSEPLWGDRADRVAAGREILRNHGYATIVGENLSAEEWDSAGTISERLDDIHSLLSELR